MDRESKLWEFVHMPSGTKGKEIPERDPATGRLIPDSDMGIVFVLLPGTETWVGTQKTDPAKPYYDPARDNDERLHHLRLSPYFLSKYEMTQGQWLRLAGNNPSYSANKNNLALPVERVSWLDCAELLQRHSLALPTEAQWEVGCRGGTTTPWWTGNDENELKANENANSGQLAVVGSKHPNPFGLCDTHGNLWEWCAEQGWSNQPLREDDGYRPGGSATYRSSRGGSFGNGTGVARASNRHERVPTVRLGIVGLRPARALSSG